MEKLKSLCFLFLSMFKIGLFTFGGGYAMIHLLEHEFVDKKSWLDHDEFMDLVTIAESTPGPIAINCATYIGYKTNKLLGAIIGTIAICLPSFCIIFIISLFFSHFLSNAYVYAAFKGIQIGVLILICSAGIKMFKKVKKTLLNGLIFTITFLSMTLLSMFSYDFSSVFYILISAIVGIFVYSILYIKSRRKKDTTACKSDSTQEVE